MGRLVSRRTTVRSGGKLSNGITVSFIKGYKGSTCGRCGSLGVIVWVGCQRMFSVFPIVVSRFCRGSELGVPVEQTGCLSTKVGVQVGST